VHILFFFRFPPQKRRHKRTLFVCTIEKAHALFNSLVVEERLLDEVGLIVIDEIHMLGEPTRGAHLECLVTKVKHINKSTELTKRSRIQLIAMSATVGNLAELARFLDHAELFTDAWRPVQLEEYVKVDSVVDPTISFAHIF
jgi:POLQ-like helicase